MTTTPSGGDGRPGSPRVRRRRGGWYAAPFDCPPYEYGIGYAMVDGLVALANVDYQSVGLDGFGKPERCLERQVDRWESQLRSYPDLYGYAGRNCRDTRRPPPDCGPTSLRRRARGSSTVTSAPRTRCSPKARRHGWPR